MFTGIVSHLGTIVHCEPLGDGRRMRIDAPADLVASLALGDSVCVDGVCSTVTDSSLEGFWVDYLAETCDKTTLGKATDGDRVNLELSLTPTDRLGGHMVSGHVDAMGEIVLFDVCEPWHLLRVQFDRAFAPLVIDKGSIGLSGISLTVCDVTTTTVDIHLIPHTISHTILRDKQVGDRLNLEFDMMAKYLQRFYTLLQDDTSV